MPFRMPLAVAALGLAALGLFFLEGCATAAPIAVEKPDAAPTVAEKPDPVRLPGSLEACSPLGDARDILARVYGEAPVGMGITRDRKLVLELFRAAEGSTFTIIAVGPGGTACILAEGIQWVDIPFTAPPGGPQT
jgi:hypothetical protein